uniref:Trimethylguanosine synthase n=1 Tax=Rhabditophanes sp. KR3021 TaxID=114890 RepID=A0AC35TFK9_9BILA
MSDGKHEFVYSNEWEDVIHATIMYDSNIFADLLCSKAYIYDDDLILCGSKENTLSDNFKGLGVSDGTSDGFVSSPVASPAKLSEQEQAQLAQRKEDRRSIRERRKEYALKLSVMPTSVYWKKCGQWLSERTWYNDFHEDMLDEQRITCQENLANIKPPEPYMLLKAHRCDSLPTFKGITRQKLGIWVDTADWDDLYTQHSRLVEDRVALDLAEYKGYHLRAKCYSFLMSLKKHKFVTGFNDERYSMCTSDSEHSDKDSTTPKVSHEEAEVPEGFEMIHDVSYESHKQTVKVRHVKLKNMGWTNENDIDEAVIADGEEYVEAGRVESCDFAYDPIRDKHLIAKNAIFELNNDKEIRKYFNQRFRLFSRMNNGILLDREGWFSVTPEKIAIHIAERMVQQKGMIVLDGFAGVGGNAIQFALKGAFVYAIELDPTRLKCARRNAEIYGVADKIEFIFGDYFKIIQSMIDSRKDRTNKGLGNPFPIDAILLSPPWGGPEYLQKSEFDVQNDIPIDGFRVYDHAKELTPNIAYFLPRNTPIRTLVALAGKGGNVEVEQSMLNAKLKTITAYYGNLISKN